MRSRTLPTRLRPLGALTLCACLATVGVFAPTVPRDIIPPGVTVAGVEIGGMPPARAQATLRARAHDHSPTVTFTGCGIWTVPAGALGVELDAPASVEQAMRLGREGTPLRRWSELLRAQIPSSRLPGEYRLDEARAAIALRRLARRIDRDPTPARWHSDADSVRLIMPEPGRRLLVAPTVAALATQVADGMRSPVPLAIEARHSPATPAIVSEAGQVLGETSIPLPPGARGANMRGALRAVSGSVIPPGRWLSAREALGPTSPGRGFVFATGDGDRVCLGGGAEVVIEALAHAARQAGLTVTRHELPALAAALSPLGEELLVGNRMCSDVVVDYRVEGDRGTLRLMGRRAPGAQLGPLARKRAGDEAITIALVGDMLPGGACESGGLGELTRSADLCVANLECAVSHRGEPLACKLAPGEWAFRAAPETARRCLRAWGVDLVSVANNHALDYGPRALADTLTITRAAGVEPAGATAPAIVDRGGLRIGLISFVGDDTLPAGYDFAAGEGRPGLAVLAVADECIERSCAELAGRVGELRLLADVVIVSLHTGVEASGAPTDAQRRLARAAAEAGADIVVGHHPHRLQPLAVVGESLVAYSLGNFVFPPARERQAHTGVLVVRADERGIVGAGFVPAIIEGRTPRAATGSDLRRTIASELLGAEA